MGDDVPVLNLTTKSIPIGVHGTLNASVVNIVIILHTHALVTIPKFVGVLTVMFLYLGTLNPVKECTVITILTFTLDQERTQDAPA